jgi:type II secretory pathway pseudopilin PulG
MKLTKQTKVQESGFSLAESIISVGIASSVLLAVIGMLAGTLGGARETRTETVAGMVTRQMLAEAREDLLQVPAPALPLTQVVLLDRAMQTLSRSRENAQLAETFLGGSPDLRAAYFVRSELTESMKHSGMKELSVTVEAPASVPAGKRKVHRYVSLLSP